jgi:hypothetical protein
MKKSKDYRLKKSITCYPAETVASKSPKTQINHSTILSVNCFLSENIVEPCPVFRLSGSLKYKAITKGSALIGKASQDIYEIYWSKLSKRHRYCYSIYKRTIQCTKKPL